MKVIAHAGKNFLAQITATEVAKLKGFTSLVAWRKAAPDDPLIGCQVDVAQALEDAVANTVGRAKVESIREHLVAEVKRLDLVLGIEPRNEND